MDLIHDLHYILWDIISANTLKHTVIVTLGFYNKHTAVCALNNMHSSQSEHWKIQGQYASKSED